MYSLIGISEEGCASVCCWYALGDGLAIVDADSEDILIYES